MEIKNYPKKLYVEGNEKILNNDSIAIVGSRKCTQYGWKQAINFGKELSENQICVISGMAIGIDKAAHIGAKSNVGKTIAVLGGGFNNIYPEENKQLYFEIIENGGCIITEYPPEEEAKSANFPKRNRIISGIALGTLVIEAAQKSGSLITARYTKEQNKPVFCLPSNIGGNKSIGTNNLIKEGAILTTNIEDIFRALKIERRVEKSKDSNIKEAEVDKEYESVYNVLENMPITVDKIVMKSRKTIGEVNHILTMLEIEGKIKSYPGNRYALVEEDT